MAKSSLLAVCLALSVFLLLTLSSAEAGRGHRKQQRKQQRKELRREMRALRQTWFGPVQNEQDCLALPEGMQLQEGQVRPHALCKDTTTEICLCVPVRGKRALRRVMKNKESVYRFRCATCSLVWRLKEATNGRAEDDDSSEESEESSEESSEEIDDLGDVGEDFNEDEAAIAPRMNAFAVGT